MNAANTAIKRLMSEAKQLSEHPDPNFTAGPINDDVLTWHFTVRGAPDTAFEGGIYHGKIVFPPQYPMKPPDIYFLTPNGRFQVRTKICLTITSFHPDTWNPAWDVRTALTSLQAFMPTPADGAVGALDTPDRERRALAVQSRSWHCTECDLELEPLPVPAAADEAPPAERPPAVEEEEEEPEPAPAEQPPPPEADGPVEDGALHVNYDEMRTLPLRVLPKFIPLLDVPIVVLFLLTVFLITNLEFHLIPLFD